MNAIIYYGQVVFFGVILVAVAIVALSLFCRAVISLLPDQGKDA